MALATSRISKAGEIGFVLLLMIMDSLYNIILSLGIKIQLRNH